ncbi:hypothetical protein VIBNISO65_1030027 [Vibrio nigripulchritudo SO65]|nr:hypothetical protein VIBNIAM115_440017 [Vibrio nigripulchritudo AM115]CCN44159.1 hypothetical protein VIBNIFTn2_710034 [Vibrio nigripulchritudo FTn2]CCN67013.1 hypothetical protein VIBNIPon4_680027 [Vibrio nigripulchritudo POn4]CCN74157.1 hypothetical protein VIBNISO65_1030027 [Vibrio nigripulchritudo SO65]
MRLFHFSALSSVKNSALSPNFIQYFISIHITKTNTTPVDLWKLSPSKIP